MSHPTISNEPGVWIDVFPRPNDTSNKFQRGHALVLGAPELIGATRLAASACSRIGAGVVTVLSEAQTQAYRTALPADIKVKTNPSEQFSKLTVMLGGPGGITNPYNNILLGADSSIRRVLDAAALSEELKGKKLSTNTVLTPHDGEFERVFGPLHGDRLSQCLHAASLVDCIIVRKGPQTIIAGPDGRAVINDSPNPFLAKAGTGDVLAGFITGLLAQSMPVFEACCAAVWIHSDAGDRLGPGLTACDLEYVLPEILRDVHCG